MKIGGSYANYARGKHIWGDSSKDRKFFKNAQFDQESNTFTAVVDEKKRISNHDKFKHYKIVFSDDLNYVKYGEIKEKMIS